MQLENLTVFSEADLRFSPQLNVFVGENGSGKTHLLKIAYTVLAVSAEEARKPLLAVPTKTNLQGRIAEKLVGVFRPESLGRLARRKPGRSRCDVRLSFQDSRLNIEFSFATSSKTEVSIDILPRSWVEIAPIYIPTRELLSIFPNFVSIYEGRYFEFEETWRDTCLLLGAPLHRGPRGEKIKRLLTPLEHAMGGGIELDRNGRFYLRTGTGRLEIPLVAEGLRKLAMLARLISAGSLIENGYLFWDEPESNLNPRLVKEIARIIVDISNSGVQVFIATHSLFLLREIEIIFGSKTDKAMDVKFFGLHLIDGEVQVAQSNTLENIGSIAALDEEFYQSDRFLKFGDENE
jgi:energy-coupling factor transporter ATP-binding protein EcfA2